MTTKSAAIDEKKLDLSSRRSSLDRAEDELSKEEDGLNAVTPSHVIANLAQTQSKKSEISPFAEPPDGGLEAWLQVLGCFLIYSNIWGFTLTFGTFQQYYENNFLSHMPPSAISWIGTTQSWFLIVFGSLSGPLFDLGYYRVMLFAGNFLLLLGIFMLSLCKTYWQVFLAQGVCMGLGPGLLYIPSMAVIGLSFSKKRSLATGIVTSGIAIGGIGYIFAFDHFSRTHGFGWAVRVMGFMATAFCVLSLPLLLRGTGALSSARTARKLWDPTAMKDPIFWIFNACSFTAYLGYIVPYFYIPVWAEDVLGLDQAKALIILVIALAACFFGRLSAGLIAHRLGVLQTWFWCAATSGIVSLSWIAVKSEAGLITFAVFWGFCSAGLVAIPAAAFPSLCPDMTKLGTRTGMAWSFNSFASLIGPPIAGALLKRTPSDGHKRIRSDFLGPQLWSGICLLCGSAVIFMLWLLRVKTSKAGIFS